MNSNPMKTTYIYIEREAHPRPSPFPTASLVRTAVAVDTHTIAYQHHSTPRPAREAVSLSVIEPVNNIITKTMTLKTKLYTLIVASILVLAAASAALAQNTAYTAFKINGTGTSGDPYQIASEKDWKSFSSMLAHNDYYDDFKDKYFKMTNDISITASCTPTDVTGSDYIIGSSSAPFCGHFDGDNHTLTFKFTTTYGTYAPFQDVNGATIENLNVAGKITMKSNTEAGGIVANSSGNTTIRNCHSSIEIHGFGASGNFGGFVGVVEENTSLNIENCVFDGKLTGSVSFRCGGFVGVNNGGTVNITDCLLASNLEDFTIGNNYFYSFGYSEANTPLNLTRAYRKFTIGTPYSSHDQGTRVYADAPSDVFTNKVTCAADGNQYWAEGKPSLTGVTTIYKPSDGNAQIAYTVTFNGTTLTENTHYTAQIRDSQGSVVSNPVSKAGEYTLTITGKGDYAGTLTLTYTVFDKSATPYIDADGTLKTADVTPITAPTTTLSTGWYAITGSTTVADRINVSGDVHLILCDGQTLTAQNGIGVVGDNSLTIYAQTNGTGTLVATGGEDYAGIGGRNYSSAGIKYESYGNITINGGIIEASGDQNCAGIGGAGAEESHTITINGGSITATSTSSGLGIGGGSQYGNAQKGGSIVLNYNNPSTRIYAQDYQGTVTLQKLFLLEGSVSLATASNIAGKTIVPCNPSIFFGDGNDGSEQKPYVISDQDGWDFLLLMLDKEYDNYKDKHYLLATDLSVNKSTSISQTFMGTFDGNGHTITVAYNDTDDYLAPFKQVSGAVFRNLRVSGTNITWGTYAGGIVGQVVSNGSVTIENCLVNVTLKANHNRNKKVTASYYGGLVGYCASPSTVNINGCIFCGSMTRTQGDEYSGGGFVGNAFSQSKITITDCIFAPVEITIGDKNFRTFGRYATINNSYYFQSHGDIQGKQARAVIPAENVEISFGTPTKTYNVSGITAYSVGMEYGDVFYAGVDDKVPVTDATEYPAFITSTLAASAGSLADGTLTMPDEDVTISAKRTATFDGDSETEISIPSPITVDEVEFSRTFTKSVYSTIVLPFSADVQGDFCEFLGVEYSDNKWIANVSSVASIVANTPYLYKAAQDGKQTFHWNVKTTLQTSTAETTVADPTYGKWTFRGVYAKESWSSPQLDIYGFAGSDKTYQDKPSVSIGDFVRAGSNSFVKPFRCYLQYIGGGKVDLGSISKSALNLPDRIEVRIVNAILDPSDPTQIVNGDPTGDFETPTSELIAPNINVWSFDKTIYIAALPNTPYTIVDMSGRQLQTGITATDRDEIHISGTFSGIVIVRIANKSFKIRY